MILTRVNLNALVLDRYGLSWLHLFLLLHDDDDDDGDGDDDGDDNVLGIKPPFICLIYK